MESSIHLLQNLQAWKENAAAFDQMLLKSATINIYADR